MTRVATNCYPLRKITCVVGRTKGWSAEYSLECGHTKSMTDITRFHNGESHQ